MDMDVITILKFEEMVALYIKILKKTITDTELELFKYNLEISCCVPNAIFFIREIVRQRRYWVKKSGVNCIVQILKENFRLYKNSWGLDTL